MFRKICTTAATLDPDGQEENRDINGNKPTVQSRQRQRQRLNYGVRLKMTFLCPPGSATAVCQLIAERG